jgi:hypothetical protein
MPTDTLADAHHEAGHAVIARGLGIEVTRIALDSIRTLQRRDDPMASFKQAVICLSGPMAEIRYGTMTADEIERMWQVHWWKDRSDAERHLRDIDEHFHTTGMHTMKEIEELARRWVEEHWPVITKVAEVLNEQGGLAPSELDRLRGQ